MIQVLDEATINQIAAGEVVERPSAIVKELIENAMDAGATAITAEIKEGGLSFIRITDNGAGIAKEDIPLAFLRHATSKIKTAEDLLTVRSLGFRGEALSSIAAVAQLELITKTPSALNGYRYIIEGGEEKSLEEIGCPGGTTIIVRNIFFNTPARRKFLKSAVTEAGYISDLMERLMVSHPEVSFKFIMNNQVKLQSSGNNSSKDILYHVYGRDISKELLPVSYASEEVKITGYIGKPVINRGNRNYENYFINGRYIKSNVITKAIEEAFKPFLMQHKYPFTSLYFEINPEQIDVNVHPQKLEIRLKNSEEVYRATHEAIRNTILGKEMIPKVTLVNEAPVKEKHPVLPEPFEENRRKQYEALINTASDHGHKPYSEKTQVPNYDKALTPIPGRDQIPYTEKSQTTYSDKGHITHSDKGHTSYNGFHTSEKRGKPQESIQALQILSGNTNPSTSGSPDKFPARDGIDLTENSTSNNKLAEAVTEYQTLTQGNATKQINLFEVEGSEADMPFLSKEALEQHRIIGQLFSTYWLVEYKKELYIIDQHAAHEKVLYERLLTAAKTKKHTSQQLLPPIVLSLTLREQEILKKQEEILTSLGYEFEHFGGNEYSVRAVPADLFGLSNKELLLDFLDELAEDYAGNNQSTTSMLEKTASLSCKAAVKANHSFTTEEATALIKELLTLENPYHCPHGRPVIVSMSQYELERKFKRII